MSSSNDLEKFASFIADSLNKIALALMLGKRISYKVFDIRNLLVKKISDAELPYLT